jgi:formate hydrogenlyase subunit 3/multisubunit Na+/H+ antiporter MnhD subunit
MIALSLTVGVLLVAVGIGGYVVSDMVSPTALIPAAFGVVILMLGLYGRAEGRRRTAMHLAMGIALVGILGSIGGVFPLLKWLTGAGAEPLPLAAASKSAMAVLLAIYLAMGIRSFVAARRR